MNFKILKKMFFYIALFIASYLAIGYFLHLVVFPENKPEITNYFKPGDVFFSKTENIKQTVVKQEGGIVYCSAEIGPFAAGPPKHIHESFDEYFEVANGELSVWVDGKVVKVKPGQKLHIPKGTPHKPFNETSDTIHMNELAAFPEKFAFGLSQIYSVMDNDPSFGKSPKTILQMAMLSSNGFDSLLVEGPPIFIQKITNFMVVPLARLLCHKSYYSEYDVKSKKFE
jgi:mannose-6-phosphate isomerase-like protein (cupin superfamily)